MTTMANMTITKSLPNGWTFEPIDPGGAPGTHRVMLGGREIGLAFGEGDRWELALADASALASLAGAVGTAPEVEGQAWESGVGGRRHFFVGAITVGVLLAGAPLNVAHAAGRHAVVKADLEDPPAPGGVPRSDGSRKRAVSIAGVLRRHWSALDSSNLDNIPHPTANAFDNEYQSIISAMKHTLDHDKLPADEARGSLAVRIAAECKKSLGDEDRRRILLTADLVEQAAKLRPGADQATVDRWIELVATAKHIEAIDELTASKVAGAGIVRAGSNARIAEAGAYRPGDWRFFAALRLLQLIKPDGTTDATDRELDALLTDITG